LPVFGAESVTDTPTVYEPAAEGVPEIRPVVVPPIERPAGRPVAAQPT
jgi:hypothetical protein